MTPTQLGERISCSPHKVQYVAGMHLTEKGSDVVFTYGASDLAPMRAVVGVGLVERLLSDGGDGTMRYPVCLARKTLSFQRVTCDELSCDRSEADEATLGLCLTLCDRFPYSCELDDAQRQRGSAVPPLDAWRLEVASLATRFAALAGEPTLQRNRSASLPPGVTWKYTGLARSG